MCVYSKKFQETKVQKLLSSVEKGPLSWRSKNVDISQVKLKGGGWALLAWCTGCAMQRPGIRWEPDILCKSKMKIGLSYNRTRRMAGDEAGRSQTEEKWSRSCKEHKSLWDTKVQKKLCQLTQAEMWSHPKRLQLPGAVTLLQSVEYNFWVTLHLVLVGWNSEDCSWHKYSF